MSFCQSKALSITTRGIGLSTCNLCFVSASAANINPPMYAMYRVFLGLVEAKLSSIKQWCYFVQELSSVYNYQIAPYMLETPFDVAIVPEPMKRIIDAVDVINCKGIQYIPVVTAQVYDEEDRLVPRPENILLSNLRAVVVALSSEDTPVKYRTAFREYCPIPGAIWNINDILINADEIIPKEYHLEESLMDDMFLMSTYLIRMVKEFPKVVNGVISEISPKLSVNGSKVALVSRDMSIGSLRAALRNVGEPLEKYYKRCHPQGSSGMFHVIEKAEVSRAECLKGQVALLGEYPNEQMLGQHPVLELYSVRRTDNKLLSSVDGEYMTLLMAANEEIFY